MQIRLRLHIYFGVISLAAAVTFVVLWMYGIPPLNIDGIQSAEHRRAVASLENLVDKSRDAFEKWFVERRRELQLVVRDEAFSRHAGAANEHDDRSRSAHRAALQRRLGMIQEVNPGAYDYLYVLDRQGKVLAASDAAILTGSALVQSHEAIHKDALQPGLTEFVYLIQQAGEPVLVVSNQVQGRDADGLPDGEVLAVVVAGISLRAHLTDEGGATERTQGHGGALMFVGPDRRVLGSPASGSGAAALEKVGNHVDPGSEGFKVIPIGDGREMLMAFRHLHLGASEGLSMVALRDSDEALASIRATFARLLGLGIIFFLAVTSLVALAARYIARSEHAIRELNATLEQRVQDRTKELNQANTKLLETLVNLERARDDLVQSEKLASLGALVAGVSHELGTPVGNAVLVASTLKDRSLAFAQESPGNLTRAALKDYLNLNVDGLTMLVANLQRTVELINNFKQLAMDQTSDQRRKFALMSLAQEVLTAMRPRLKVLPYQLVLDIPDDLEMDSYPGPLSRIIINFINNSLLHGFEGRSAGTMKLSATLIGLDQVEIRFEDDGIGMQEHVAKRAFDPFFTTKLGQGGNGLGLNIVYTVTTTILAGRVELQTAVGGGACFCLTLPRVAPVVQQSGQDRTVKLSDNSGGESLERLACVPEE